jgi:hypothetical protein
LLSLEKGWFPGLDEKISAAYPSGVVSSKSDPDLSQLALSIGNTILNKAKVGSQFELTIGLRNTNTGSNIDEIISLDIIIPNGTKKADVGCEGFTMHDNLNKLTLNESQRIKLTPRLGEIEKGFKAVKIASCVLDVTSNDFLSNPNKVESKFFTGRITYSQIVKKEFKVRKDTATAASDATSVKIDVSQVSSANSVIEEKVRSFARELGVPEGVALAVARQENGLKHYNADGSVTKGSTSPDWGAMQINEGVHSSEGCFDSSATKKGMCAVDSCQNTNVKDSVDCNIKAGIKLLKICYDNRNLDGKYYACTGKTYKDWEYAVRCYNGWNPCNQGDPNYVEKVAAQPDYRIAYA